MKRFIRCEDQVLVILPECTVSFSTKVEFTNYILKHLPLEVLLSSLQCRTAEFAKHKKATDKLKEIADGVTAAGVAEMLTMAPPSPQKVVSLDDRLDMGAYRILTQYGICPSSDEKNFDIAKINTIS